MLSTLRWTELIFPNLKIFSKMLKILMLFKKWKIAKLLLCTFYVTHQNIFRNIGKIFIDKKECLISNKKVSKYYAEQ